MPELAYREEPLTRHIEEFHARCEEPSILRAYHEDLHQRLRRLHGYLGGDA